MEGELLKILQQAKEASLAATLTFTTRGGKIKAKLEVELEPAAPCPNGPTPSTATTPAPGEEIAIVDRQQRREPPSAMPIQPPNPNPNS